MNIIYDNIIYSLQQAGGISLYWSELSRRLQLRYPESFFYGYPQDNVFAAQISISVKRESCWPARLARYMPFMSSVAPGSIFHSSYYRVCRQAGVYNVTTVHDFTYEYYRHGLALRAHRWQKKQAVLQAAGIICISQNTKRDLLKFFPQVDPAKVQVIYNGVSDCFFPLDDPSTALQSCFPGLIAKPYVLFVGQRGGYKNFAFTAKLLRKQRELGLVLVGGGPLSTAEQSQLEGISYNAYEVVSPAELNVLYNSAFCLLYPSAYEGFGIPVLEAMRAGCPVVAANSSSLAEVGGEAAILCQLGSSADFQMALTVLQQSCVRVERIKKGLRHAAGFSWDRCFEQTLSFYQRVLND